MGIVNFAQFIAVCRRAKVVDMGTGRHQGGARLCRRWALQRREDTPRLRQILRATKCDKLSDISYQKRGMILQFYFVSFTLSLTCEITHHRCLA